MSTSQTPESKWETRIGDTLTSVVRATDLYIRPALHPVRGAAGPSSSGLTYPPICSLFAPGRPRRQPRCTDLLHAPH